MPDPMVLGTLQLYLVERAEEDGTKVIDRWFILPFDGNEDRHAAVHLHYRIVGSDWEAYTGGFGPIQEDTQYVAYVQGLKGIGYSYRVEIIDTEHEEKNRVLYISDKEAIAASYSRDTAVA